MKRLKSKFSVISLALIMSLSLAACAPSQEPAQEAPQAPVESTETEQVEEADVVKDAANAYFANMPENIYKIDEKELVEKVKAEEDILVVDIRSNEDYNKGHLKNAVNIHWGPAIAENLENLPVDKDIYLYCYTGQTAGQATALLNMAGYNVRSINLGWKLGLSNVEGIEEVTQTEAVELVKSTPADIAPELKDAIKVYFDELVAAKGTTYENHKISEDDAKALLDAKDESIQFLSVRKAEDYAKGHIEGAINIPFGKGMQESFGTLPTDKKIIVYCYTGQTAGQAVAGLRILGYDAVSMNFGAGTPATGEGGWINKGYPLVQE